nr:hypothetical protein [Moorella humiferrea]
MQTSFIHRGADAVDLISGEEAVFDAPPYKVDPFVKTRFLKF